MNEQQVAELFRTEWPRIPVGPAPVDAVAARAGRRRRGVVRGVVGGVVVGLAAAAVLAVVVVAQDDDPREVRPLGPEGPVVDNPVDVSWAADDVLHLDRTTVRNDAADEIEAFIASHAAVAEGEAYGVVYVDLEGDVVHADSLGRTRRIGEAAPERGVVAGSLSSGWAAWVDPSGETPELVVHDTVEDRELTRQPLPDEAPADDAWVTTATATAVDGETVWVRTPGGDLVWEPGEPLRESPYADRWVVGAADGTIVTRSKDPGDMTLEYGDADGPVTSVPGGGAAAVSADGRYVLSQRRDGVGDGTDDPADWQVHDAVNGGSVPLDLPRLPAGDRIEQAAFGAGSVHFVLARYRGPVSAEPRRWQVVSCDLADGVCETVLDLAADEVGLDVPLRLAD
ncbi:hypothetical protein [Nocardioides dongkuii]|uniref:hypothetical protein n=1 Tax=Nocardioides dongkuii TaxID=2760089 RepID=UPI0015FD5FB6|nr:hypothetical protein [Nocardioides dongkuii]